MNKYQTSDVIVNKIAQQLDISITSLDEEIKHSLSASRKAALAKADRLSEQSFFNFNWKQSAAFASALIIVVTASVMLFSTDSETLVGNDSIAFLNANYDIADDAIIAEYELLNELEFITWLVEEDNESNAS